jgi:hypothetical protein
MNKREQRLNEGAKVVLNVVDAIRKNDADSARAAKERADARKAKYPEETRYVKFLAVPRGSKPLTAKEIDEAMNAAGEKPTIEAKEGDESCSQ